jgi:hypothetical protein
MPTLFNHSHHFHAYRYEDQASELYEKAIHLGPVFAARALPLSSPQDVVQLDPRYKEAYKYYLDHLKQVGLDTASEIIWDVSAEIANDFPNHTLSCFRFNPSINRVRPNQRRLDATERFNNKNKFISFCQEQGDPTPLTINLSYGKSPDFTVIKYPVYVKSATMASGLNIYRCKNEKQLRDCLQNMRGEYQIQAEVPDVQAFISTQYFAADGQATHLATTEQLLKGFSYLGNVYPTLFDPRVITDSLASKLAHEGLEGFFGFDLAATPNGFWIIECNARVTGATYPIQVAKRLGIRQWKTLKLNTKHQSLRTLNLSSVAFDHKRGYGVVVLNDSFMPFEGEITVLLAGPTAAQDETQAKLITML